MLKIKKYCLERNIKMKNYSFLNIKENLKEKNEKIRYLESKLVETKKNFDQILINKTLDKEKSIQEIAAVIYRKALKNRAVKRQRVEAKIAAALYAALRISKIPRTLDEIAKVSQHTKKELGKCYRLQLKE